MRRSEVVAAAAVVVAAGAILGATLHPVPDGRALGWSGCIVCGARGTADALANVALFVPLGIALALAGLRFGRAAGAAALLSAAIELLQQWIPGRDPAPPDLLFNTLGAAVGGLAVLLWRRGPPSSAGAAWRGAAWAAVCAAGVLFTGHLARPAPPLAPLRVQWTPEIADHPVYSGRVLSAAAGPTALHPDAWIPDRGAAHRGTLVVAFVAGDAPSASSPLLRVVGRGGGEAVSLFVRNGTLRVRWRTGADALRLDAPTFEFPGALRGVATGDTVRLSAVPLRSGVRLDVGGVSARLRIPLARSWVYLAGGDVAPDRSAGEAAMDALWMAALALPLGFWLRRRAASLLAGAGGTAVLLLGPVAAGLAPPDAAAVQSTGAGLIAGVLLGALAARRRPRAAPSSSVRRRGTPAPARGGRRPAPR